MPSKFKGRNVLISLLVALFFGDQRGAYDPQVSPSSNSTLKWEGCGELSNHTVECKHPQLILFQIDGLTRRGSRLDVPMNHFNKSSEKTFSIPVIRLLATNASATGDRHILLNPGGPGVSGVKALWGVGARLNKVIGEGFNLLSFDPRGVSGSIPQAVCYPSGQKRARELSSYPWNLEYESGKMYTQAENKARACADTMGEHGAYVNTPQTAADMDAILDALGQDKMYYWGFSYGSTLGQTYAQMFPDRVARLIIDGVSDLDEWYNQFCFEKSLIDTDRIFSGFVEECFKAKDACPLNSLKDKSFKSSSELKTYIDDFLAELEEEPIPVYVNNDNYGAITRREVAYNGIFTSLSSPSHTWPSLASNLAALLNGNATPAYNAYSDPRHTIMGGHEAHNFVILNDNLKTGVEAPVHGIKNIRNYTLSQHETSFLISRYKGSDAFGLASWVIPTTHNFRPKCHPEFPRVKTAEPILVLSTTWDPVCPLASAKKAANNFEGAGLVEQKSYGHCSLSMPSSCTAGHVNRYFNEGIVPKPGTTCDIDAEYFPAPEKSPVDTMGERDEEFFEGLKVLAEGGGLRAFVTR